MNIHMIDISMSGGMGMPLTDFYLNNDVSKLTGISQRQVLSWTEKRLIKPERPARKAGTRRGYSYFNLLEFGLAKYLIDVLNVQFFTAHQILEEMREDGEFMQWATNYKNYFISWARRTSVKSVSKNKADFLAGYHARTQETASAQPTEDYQHGTLYYIYTAFEGPQAKYVDTLRIISPWGFEHCIEDFKFENDLQEALNFKGMIVVNLGKIKADIDRKIRETEK